MRVTQTMINRSMIRSISESKENLSVVQNQISSGKKITDVSDDPVGFIRSNNYKNYIINNEEYIDNISDGIGWMEMTYGVLDEVYELVVDARDRSIQGADEVSGGFQRTILSGEIDSILKSVLALSNTSYQDKHIFAGTQTIGDKPFTMDENDNVVYDGNSEAITRRIYENYDITINMAGDELLDSGVFENLKILKDALANGDIDAISSSITNLDETSNSLMSSIAHINSIKNQADMTRVRLETANINLASYISDTEDTDMAEAIARYGVEEMAYKAALQTTSDAINLNILDYLR